MADIIKEDAPYAEFGRRLRALREAAGLSRDQLAMRCGLVGRTLINYETGVRIPYADTAARLAAVFGITVEDLIGLDEPAPKALKTEAVESLRQIYGKKGANQAEILLDGASSVLAGGTLTKEQQEDFILEMQKLFIIATERAKAKYTPHKYRSDEKEAASRERLQRVAEIDSYLGGKNNTLDEDE